MTIPRFLTLSLALLLAACAHRAPLPDWQIGAHDAARKASAAYLSGDERVAEQEWARAREAVARTGQPELLARVELMRCAAQTASLVALPCSGFDALRADATPEEAAYADYLGGRVDPARAALLPAAQRAAAASVQAIAGIADPLSRLVAAGSALRAARADTATADAAIDAASSQGWRRPLLAWLLVRQQQARAEGDAPLAAALARRIAVVEGVGAPPAAPSPGASQAPGS